MQATIAVDLAKNVFEIAISRFPGKVSERHRLSRTKFLRFFASARLRASCWRPVAQLTSGLVSSRN